MFLKIDDLILNSDKIVSIEDTDEGLHVFTALTAEAAQPYYLIPNGKKADVLRRWLSDFAIDLLEVDEDAAEQELVQTMNNGAGGVTYDIHLEKGVTWAHHSTAPLRYNEDDDSEMPYIS